MATLKYTPQAAAAIVLACIAAPGQAAEWTTTAGVAPGVTYTDNVCLERDNQQSQWIALVTPDFGVRADGNRANLSLTGSVEVNSLSDGKLESLGCNQRGAGSNRQQFAPRLNGSADTVLVENWLFLDARANIYQNDANPFQRGEVDSLNRSGNTNTTYQYNISPYVTRRLKDAAEVDLRYTYDEQYNTDDFIDDSTQQRAEFNLDSVPGVNRLIWGIGSDYSKVSYAGNRARPDRDSTLKSARLKLGYQLNRSWQVNGYYGDEWNDYLSFNDDIDGQFWDVGMKWTPNERTTVDAGTGHRYFGNSPRFAINYRHKHSVFSATYSKELSYDRNIRALGQTPAPDPGLGLPPGVNPGGTTFSTSPILDERFTVSYAYEGRRSGFGLSAFQSDQTREEDGSDSSFRGISASANRNLSRQLSVSCRLSRNEQQPRSAGNALTADSEYWVFNLGASRQLGLNTKLDFDYRYTDRQSDISLDEYSENRFTVTLRVAL